MWASRLRDEPRFLEALESLWPYALGVLDEERRPALLDRARAFGFEVPDGPAVERGVVDEFPTFWEEMTMVRRSAPVGAQW
jgi:hypothetical protein